MERFFLHDVDPEIHDQRRRTLIDLVRQAAPFADVHEVGSTAIPGVIGKGDLDVMARCAAPQFAELCRRLDLALTFNPDQLHDAQYRGYRWMVDHDELGAVQATVAGCRYDTFLAFAEQLQADSTRLEAYNTLKRMHDGSDMSTYRTAKAAFIERVLAGPEVPHAVPYSVLYASRTPTFTVDTVPAGLLHDHTTKSTVWGRIVVEQGQLQFRIEGHTFTLKPGVVGGIPPQVPHSVELAEGAAFYVEFCRPNAKRSEE